MGWTGQSRGEGALKECHGEAAAQLGKGRCGWCWIHCTCLGTHSSWQNRISKEASVRPGESPAPSLPLTRPHATAPQQSPIVSVNTPEQHSELCHGTVTRGCLLSDPLKCSRCSWTLQSCRTLLTATRDWWDSHPAFPIFVRENLQCSGDGAHTAKQTMVPWGFAVHFKLSNLTFHY